MPINIATLGLTACLVTEATLAKGPDLPIRFHSNGAGGPVPIPQDGKVVFLFPGQGFRGMGHGLIAKMLVEGMMQRGYGPPLGAIGSSSGGPAAAIAGMVALGDEAPRFDRRDIEGMWLAVHRLVSQPGQLVKSLIPGPQHEVRRALTDGIDFEAIMRSPTTVGLVGAENCLPKEAGPLVGALAGLAVTFGQYLVHPDSEYLPGVAAVQFGYAMKALRHAWRAMGWVNHLPQGVTKPQQVRVVQDADEMRNAMLATMNLPGLFGLGYAMITDLGPEGTKTRVLDGAIAMGAAVTEAVLLGATDIIVITDSACGNVHWNDVSAAILKGVCQASKLAEALPIPSRRVRRMMGGTTAAFKAKTTPRDVVRTFLKPEINHDNREIHLYAIPVLPDHFPRDVIRFGEFRPSRIGQVLDLSQAMAAASLEALFPNV